VTNVIKRQIAFSDDEKFKIHPDEFTKWCELVLWEVGQLPNVEVIVLFGGEALEAFLCEKGIDKWRGSVIDLILPNNKRGKAICANNPADALRTPKVEVTFMMNCKRIEQVLTNKFKPYKVDGIINPTYRDALNFISDLQRSDNPVALDIEGLNDQTACIGLSNDPHRAMCINWRDDSGNRYSVGQEASILTAIQDLCDSHRIVAQNGGFDSYWCWLRDRIRIRIWFDTLLAHHTLYPQLPHNLGYLTSQYTTHPFYKDEGDYWKEGGDIDEFWKYNCKDAAITYRVYEREYDELERQKLKDFFFGHVMRAQPHLVEATVHGVAVDQTVKEVIAREVNRYVAEMENEFHRLVHEATEDMDYNPNPASWPQMKELFFRRLNLQGKGTSTDKTNRNHILQNAHTRPIEKEMLSALDAWKKEDKFRSTYATSKESKDGRFRCEYKQYGVSNAPGRLSSSELINGEGGNMQNQPVRARGFFVSDPGTVLIYFDLAQAEAQVVGFRADIMKWKEQFAQAKKDGIYDCHRALAAEMFKVPYDSVPVKDWDENNHPTIRYVAKRCRHGLNYRMERFRLAEVTELPYHQAARAFQLYHRTTPELVPWWDRESYEFKKTRTMYNALGRRFRVLQRMDEEVMKSVIAFYPQSTIGDKVVQTWYMSEEDDEWPKGYARIAINVHDNLVGIVEPAYAKTALKVLKKHAESPIWIQDVHMRRLPEPLSIAAELKMSYPTIWDDKLHKFIEDKKGLHRWSNMQVVKL
jgi:DNA polymerase I-like protein with 3'-5' exonuclease and polymerase domains